MANVLKEDRTMSEVSLPLSLYKDFEARTAELLAERKAGGHDPVEWYAAWETLGIARVQTIQQIHRRMVEERATEEEVELVRRLIGDPSFERDRAWAPDER